MEKLLPQNSGSDVLYPFSETHKWRAKRKSKR